MLSLKPIFRNLLNALYLLPHKPEESDQGQGRAEGNLHLFDSASVRLRAVC